MIFLLSYYFMLASEQSAKSQHPLRFENDLIQSRVRCERQV